MELIKYMQDASPLFIAPSYTISFLYPFMEEQPEDCWEKDEPLSPWWSHRNIVYRVFGCVYQCSPPPCVICGGAEDVEIVRTTRSGSIIIISVFEYRCYRRRGFAMGTGARPFLYRLTGQITTCCNVPAISYCTLIVRFAICNDTLPSCCICLLYI